MQTIIFKINIFQIINFSLNKHNFKIKKKIRKKIVMKVKKTCGHQKYYYRGRERSHSVPI